MIGKFNFIGLLFLILSTSLNCVYAFQLPIDHPHYVPEFTGGMVKIAAGAGHREIEYESNNVVVENESYKFNESRLEVLFSPWKNFAFGLVGHYDFDREYELKFGPASARAGEANYSSSASGPLDPEIFFVYEFHSKKNSWNQQVYLRGNPFDIEEAPRKIFRGGHDVFLEYRFSHQYENGSLYGVLFSHYFGKKNFFQPGDPRPSRSEPFTEVGLNLGYLFKFSKDFSFFVDGTFGLSSDYVVRTPELNRTADKGYQLFAKAGINYFWDKNIFFTLQTWRGSRIYNATQESLNRDIDYEIEDEFYFFSFSYAWGKIL